MISALRAGVIEVEGIEEADARIFVAGGFAEVAGDRMTVLAEDAVKVSDLDRGQLEQRIADAREDVEDAKDDRQRQFEEGKLAHLEDMLAALR